MIRVCVGPNGKLAEEPTVANSSGSARLDEGAIKLAKAGRYVAGSVDGAADHRLLQLPRQVRTEELNRSASRRPESPAFFLIEETMENEAPPQSTTSTIRTVCPPSGQQGDYRRRARTLIVLVLMSLFSWYIMLTKLWDQRKLKQSAKVVEKQFWTAPSVKDGVERLKKGDDFRIIAEDGLRAASHHDGRLTDRIDLHEWITMSLQRSVDR